MVDKHTNPYTALVTPPATSPWRRRSRRRTFEMDHDSLLDGLISSHVDPRIYAGELILSGCRPTCHREWSNITSFFLELDPAGVRAVSMQGFPLGKAPAATFQKIVFLVGQMASLQKLNVSGCSLSKDQLRLILSEVSRISAFALPREEFIPSSKTKVKLFSELHVGGNGMNDDAFSHAFGRNVMAGIGKFSVAESPVTEAIVKSIVNLMPSLPSLHLEDTFVDGTSAGAAIVHLPFLTLLGLDGTCTGEDGATSVLAAMKFIKNRPRCTDDHLEVRIRGTKEPPNGGWISLLDFTSRATNTRQFLVKHDMQEGLGYRPAHKVKKHERVMVVLCIPNENPIEIEYNDIVSCKQASKLAEEAIAELNLVCHGDTKDVRDGMVMQRRRRYRELLEPLLLQGKLYKKQFRPGISTMEKTDRFTKENSFQTVSKNLLLGIPDPSVDLTVRVETEDDT